MPTIDELRDAGFDDNEIDEYVSTKSEEFRSAGFDDNEIGKYFGQPAQPAQPAPFAQEGVQFQGLPPGASAPISAITGQPVPTAQERFAGAEAALSVIPYAFASATRGMIPEALETTVMQPVTQAITGRDYISPITTAQQVSGAKLPPEAQQVIGMPAELIGMSAPLSIAFKTSNAIMKAVGLPADLVIGNASIAERMAYGVMRGGTAGAIYGGLESPDKIEQDAAIFAALEAGFGASGAIVHKVFKSNWFRKLEIPERSLVVQTADDMLAAGHSEGKILRTLSDPAERARLAKQALAKRVTPEEPVAERLKKKLEVKPVAPKPIEVKKPEKVSVEPKPEVKPAEPVRQPVEFKGIQKAGDKTFPIVELTEGKMKGGQVDFDPKIHKMVNEAAYQKAIELAVKPPVEPPTKIELIKPTVKRIYKPTTLERLSKETQKHKSVTSFVKALPKVFRGTQGSGEIEKIEKNWDIMYQPDYGANWTDSFDDADKYARGFSQIVNLQGISRRKPTGKGNFIIEGRKLPDRTIMPIKATNLITGKEIHFNIAEDLWKQIKAKPPTKPIAKPPEIPEFKTTQESVKFGATATPEQLEQVKQKIEVFRRKTKEAAKIKDFDTMSIQAGKVSIYDEATRAKEIIAEHPELFPDLVHLIKPKKPVKPPVKVRTPADIAAERKEIETEAIALKETQALIKLTGKKPKARKDLKGIIRKKAGLIKPDQEITVKERASLTNQIKLEAVAARKAFAAGKKEAAIKHKIQQLAIIERLKAKFEVKVEKIKTAKDILTRRRASITAIQKHFGLTDKDLRKITTRDIRLMSNLEFKQFKDKIENIAEKLEKKRIARQQLEAHIMEKKVDIENLRKAMKLPTMKNMKISDIQRLDAALEPYQKGDEFLSPRKLQTVDRTELAGIKTWREARERLAKRLKIPVEDLTQIKVSEFDRFKYDTGLAETNPFYRMMVEETTKRFLTKDAEILAIEKKLFRLAKKLPGGLVKFAIPQHKKIMKYMETSSDKRADIKLTPEESALVDYMTSEFKEMLDYLIQIEALTQGRQNYMTHVRRGILEAVKEDGWTTAFKEIFEKYKEEEQAFNILDRDTGEVLAMDKFFKFAMHRVGKIKPTQNVVKAFLTYVRIFKRKQALDEIVPLIDIYAHALTPKGLTKHGLLLHGDMIRFVKEWLNTQKGRHITILAKQGGKIDAALRAVRMFTTMRDLAINIPVSVATEVGEQVTTYQLLGKVNFIRGKIRQNTKQGKKIIEKYRNLIGKNPWKELAEPAKDIGDRLMEGIFILFRDASVRSNKTFLLGSLSKEEFKSGVISDERLAKLRIELGRYRMVEGMKSVIGATPEGKAYTQYKRWAIPILRTTIKNLGTIAKKITFQKPGSKEFKKSMLELYRLVEVTAFAMLMFGMVRDENDRSFIGRMINKAYREATTLIQALQPVMFLTAGRTVAFIKELGENLTLLFMLEKYKTTDEYKGVKKLKKQVTPVAISQFQEPKKGKKKKPGYYKPALHKPER